MRILVAIANHGTKNAKYLERVLKEYRSMKKYEVRVVVLSNVPKDLGPGVEVIVGLPDKDPWSLPYGHKTLFAERRQQYDLFIYSEDDTLMTERNIDAFVRVTAILPAQYIAGFIRHEISAEGRKSYSTIHGHFHWDPASVLKIGSHVFAHYTNEHAACFILTRGQLDKALASGGFMRPPRKGRYDMLVTAATDPYTQCGMKKLVCVSHLDEFCLRHLPDVYCGRIGLDAEWADREIGKLMSLADTATECGPLFQTSTLLEDAGWDKTYYEPCREDVLSLIPKDAERVLSVGCASGTTESVLVGRGVEVQGISLDCVIQVSAAARGVRMLPPSFGAARKALQGEHFDCVLLVEVLQHLADPVAAIREYRELLAKSGTMVISVPNWLHPSVIRQRMQGGALLPKLFARGDFSRYRIHLTTRRMLDAWLAKCGLRVTKTCCPMGRRYERLNQMTFEMFDGLLTRNIVVQVMRDEQ